MALHKALLSCVTIPNQRSDTSTGGVQAESQISPHGAAEPRTIHSEGV